MMRLLIKACVTACLMMCGPGVVAQDSSLNRLDDWSEARGWEGVGLLQIDGRSTCTGALIRPDLVLTAAHCLYAGSGAPVQPALIDFRAAWRDGQAISRRVGKHALIHPNYRQLPRPTGDTIYHDLALLQLDAAVSPDVAMPFAIGALADQSDELTVVSYGRGRNDAASIERGCELYEDTQGVFAMGCSVVPGSSGSPVFQVEGGVPRIVSVVSALGYDGTSFGMDLSDHVHELLADFDSGLGVYPAVVQSLKRLSASNSNTIRRITIGGNTSSSGGARFLKP